MCGQLLFLSCLFLVALYVGKSPYSRLWAILGAFLDSALPYV